MKYLSLAVMTILQQHFSDIHFTPLLAKNIYAINILFYNRTNIILSAILPETFIKI